MGLTFRVLTKVDAEKYRQELIRLMGFTHGENWGFSQEISDKLSEDYVSKIPGFIEDNSAVVIGTFSGDKLVGYLWGYVRPFLGETRMHSYFSAVDPEYRRNHIAQTQMYMLCDEAKKRGIRVVECMVTATNEASVQYHLKTGFTVEQYKMVKVLE